MRALLLAALAIAAPVAADPLQDQALAGMKRVDTGDVAFTSTTQIERTGAGAHEVVTRYDPRQPTGKRWSLLRMDGRAPTAKESADVVKAANRSPLPGYRRLMEWFGGPATRVAQGPGSVTYRFAHLPAGVVKIGSHDASADTVADAVVNTGGKAPFVEHIRFASTAPFRMMLVAKVERYLFASTYQLLPDGRPFAAAVEGEMVGSLMGKDGSLKTHARYAPVR